MCNGFAISPVLQEMMTYVGQLEVYGKGVEVLKKLAGVAVNEAQLYRVTDFYGELLESEIEEQKVNPRVESKSDIGQHEVVYAEIDGSMIFTDDKWREVKVGRFFEQKACCKSTSEGRNGCIEQSQYVAYLGNYQEFARRFDLVLSPYRHLDNRLVFITDGALWIKNWIKENYPTATQVLDLYHVKEHLGRFAELTQYNLSDKQKWLEEQAERLKQGELGKVIDSVRAFTLPLLSAREGQEKLLNYLSENEYRMQYKDYIERGLFIGSGAIEAAHRTVVQCRLKRSGQRWSIRGAQNMLNLRTAFMGNNWQKVVNLIQNSAKQAA
jgi:hypothetical protein